MKKIIAIVLVAGMAVSLAACNSSSSETSSTSDTSSTGDTDTTGDTSSTGDTDTTGDTGNTTDEEPDPASITGPGPAVYNGENDDSDWAYILTKDSFVVGITDFEPMDYQDDNGDWIGFDADLARAFADSLGCEIEFVEIDWDNKILELDGKSIDCVWNGMTLTDEVTSSMECSNAYCNNQQVVIVPTDVADEYKDADSLSGLTFAVEAGSAGEEQATEYGFDYTPVESQANALMEVAAGTSDAAIIDSLMAAAMVGEGTGYEDLTYTVGLNDEKYGVGFRKDSDMAEVLNDFFKESYEDGTIMELAEKYGVQASIIEQ